MPYCRKCGAEMPEGTNFCTICGTPLKMGLERVNQVGQGLWLYRIIAYIIDSIVIGLTIALITIIASIPFILFTPRALISLPSLLTGIISIAYFALMEWFYGFTIGKRFMRINVVAVRGGRPTPEMAFIRNISKIHWILLLLDLFLGLLTPGDPSQKFSDRYAGTTIRRA